MICQGEGLVKHGYVQKGTFLSSFNTSLLASSATCARLKSDKHTKPSLSMSKLDGFKSLRQ